MCVDSLSSWHKRITALPGPRYPITLHCLPGWFGRFENWFAAHAGAGHSRRKEKPVLPAYCASALKVTNDQFSEGDAVQLQVLSIELSVKRNGCEISVQTGSS